MKAKIAGIGYYVPEKIIDNKFIAERYGLQNEEFVHKRSGILTRRFVTTENTSDLAVNAIKDLLVKSEVSESEIDCVIIGTITPESFAPSTATLVIKKLNLSKAFGMDISAACAGFCYGLELGKMYIETGKYKNVIVCGAEVMSRALNNYDYKTGILFGDGAGAALLSATNENEIIVSSECKVITDYLEDVTYKTPFSSDDWATEILQLKGTRVYRHGVTYTIDLISQFLKENDLTLNDFKFVVPHQSNIRMLTEIAEGLSSSLDKFLINLDHFGNTAAASIPICLAENYANGKIQKGDRLMLCSFGARRR
jgi:3-oxoacyl-[acyl-carrier-protein] synthase-3